MGRAGATRAGDEAGQGRGEDARPEERMSVRGRHDQPVVEEVPLDELPDEALVEPEELDELEEGVE